jgi:hypothetical protein
MGNQIENVDYAESLMGFILYVSAIAFAARRCGGRETFCSYSRNHNHAHSFMRERRVMG